MALRCGRVMITHGSFFFFDRLWTDVISGVVSAPAGKTPQAIAKLVNVALCFIFEKHIYTFVCKRARLSKLKKKLIAVFFGAVRVYS